MANLNSDGYTVVVATLPRKGQKALMFGRYFQTENDSDDYLAELSDYSYGNNFKYPVVTLAIPGNVVNAIEFGLGSDTNPTEWIDTLEEYTKRVNNSNPEDLTINFDNDGNEVFTDSIIQIRDISPVGAVNYISMVCKRKNHYGYYQGDIFVPFDSNSDVVNPYVVMKESATADDFKQYRDRVDDFNRNNTDDQIDCMIWCKKSMLDEDEAKDESITAKAENNENTIVLPSDDPDAMVFADLTCIDDDPITVTDVSKYLKPNLDNIDSDED